MVVVSTVGGQEEFCQYLPVTNRLFNQKRYFMLIINAMHLTFVELGIDNHSGLFTWKLNTHIFDSPPALFKYIVFTTLWIWHRKQNKSNKNCAFERIPSYCNGNRLMMNIIVWRLLDTGYSIHSQSIARWRAEE